LKFSEKFQIDGRMIGLGQEPYIIAEMSANHGGQFDKAVQIIHEAKKSGAHAIKLQTYTAETLTLDCKQKHFEAKGAWKGEYLYDLYTRGSMPWEWTEELQKISKDIGITLFSSPFDFSAVDFLESLNMPAYKIASPELIDIPLIKRVAETGKPIIMSTGGATLQQIEEAVESVYDEGVRDLAILKCTSEYPAPVERVNLITINDLIKRFKCVVGISDHTIGSAIPIASVAIGASIIEKHFLVDKDYKTIDSFFSALPKEMQDICDGASMVFRALGRVDYASVSQTSRSLIAIKDITKGEKLINNFNFKSLRPGGGIEPKYLKTINGSLAKVDIPYGSLLDWDLIRIVN